MQKCNVTEQKISQQGLFFKSVTLKFLCQTKCMVTTVMQFLKPFHGDGLDAIDTFHDHPALCI